MSKVFTISLIFLLTISIIASTYTPRVEAQTLGSQITTTTLAIPYLNPYYFTILNGTQQYIAVMNSPTELSIYELDSNNNPKLDQAVYTYNGVPVLRPQGTGGMLESNAPIFFAFVSDNQNTLILFYVYQASVNSGGTIGAPNVIAIEGGYVGIYYNETTSSWTFFEQGQAFPATSLNMLTLSSGSGQSRWSISGDSFLTLQGQPTIVVSAILTSQNNQNWYMSNIVFYFSPATLGKFIRTPIVSGGELPMVRQNIKTIFIGHDNIQNAIWLFVVRSEGTTTSPIMQYRIGTDDGSISLCNTFNLPFQFNYYQTSELATGIVSGQARVFTQSVLSYPTEVFENIDASSFRMNIQNWMVDQTTGQTVLAYIQIVALRDTFNSATIGYTPLLAIPSPFPPISAPILFTAINEVITYRQFIWNVQSIQYATYIRNLATSTYSFQGWTTIQTPSGWSYPSWVTRYYIWSSLSTGYKLLSYYTPFTAIGGYNPPDTIGEDGGAGGAFPIAESLTFTILTPFLIIFLPPAIISFTAGKVGFFIGLILTLSVGTYVGVVPVWMIFLVGIGLVLLLYSRFGRDSVETVGE